MTSRRAAKSGPGFRTTYESEPGQIQEQSFHKQEDNDSFAQGLELMGVKNIVKSFYNPHMLQWVRYHRDVYQNER